MIALAFLAGTVFGALFLYEIRRHIYQRSFRSAYEQGREEQARVQIRLTMHRALDQLMADWAIENPDRRFADLNVFELAEWSNRRTL